MKKGFTILELVVVLSVLVILIGIAIPRIKGMQDSAKIVQAQAELKTLQTAVETYYMNSNPRAYPVSSANVACPNTSNTMYANLLGATPQVLPDILYDPFCPSPDLYGYAFYGQYYVIFSVGKTTSSNIGRCGIDGDSGVVTCYMSGGNNPECTPGQSGCPICVTNGKGC